MLLASLQNAQRQAGSSFELVIGHIVILFIRYKENICINVNNSFAVTIMRLKLP
jgi:hypothetical protein